MKTVKQVRSELHKPATKPRVWGTARRLVTFGTTANAVRRRLVTVDFCGKHVAVHKKVAASLARVEGRIRADEKKHGWTAWKPSTLECFAWRKIRGGSSLSRHASAIAIDIDPGVNKSYGHYSNKIETNLPTHVVQAFEDEGWTWGGNWTQPCDTMHVQYA